MTDLHDRIHALEAELTALKAELAEPTAATPRSRRQLLRTAVATAAGAVGSAAVVARPATAATGGNVVLGQDNTADAVTGIANNGPFPNLSGPGPIALKLTSPGGHLQFVGNPGDAIFGTYPDGTLAYNASEGLVLFTGGGRVTVASPSTSALHLLAAPERVYDSRNGDGPLSGGQTRTVNLGASTGGEVFLEGQAGVMLNVTVVNTVGAGFLSLYSAAVATPPGSSSVNWSASGQILANMTMVAIDQGSVKITAGGGGSTDIVIDVLAVLG